MSSVKVTTHRPLTDEERGLIFALAYELGFRTFYFALSSPRYVR